MTPLSQDRVRRWLHDLRAALAERGAAETRIFAHQRERAAAIEAHYAQRRTAVDARHVRLGDDLNQEHADVIERQRSANASERREVEHDYATRHNALSDRFSAVETAANKEVEEARWTLDAVHDGAVKEAKKQYSQLSRAFQDHAGQATRLRGEVDALLERWNLDGYDWSPPPAPDAAARLGSPLAGSAERLARAKADAALLNKLKSPGLAARGAWVWLPLPVTLLVSAGLGVYWSWLFGPLIGIVLYALLAVVGRWGLARLSERGSQRHLAVIDAALSESEGLRQVGLAEAERTSKAAIAASKEQANAERKAAESAHRKTISAATQRRDRELAEADTQKAELLRELAERTARETAEAEAAHAERRQAWQRDSAAERDAVDAEAQKQRDELQAWFDTEFGALQNRWREQLAALRAGRAEIDGERERLFPAWSRFAGNGWQPASVVPAGMPFGRLDVDQASLPGGPPRDSRLERLEPERFDLPALLPFPARGSLAFHVAEGGRTEAVQSLQAVMLRMLTAIPPGKVRFTLVDPVGLGESFAGFMHLADSDEQLVTSRIWTEPQQIERRLSDLTQHMENVIQKYLRNQFTSIEEYNAQAGEVAEPYRVLVIANFPVNFTLEAARRLVSIAASGASCGVYALVSVDARLPMPQGFPLEDLEAACENLTWKGGSFHWRDDDFASLPLTVEAPPPAEALTPLLSQIGKAAKASSRVEVDFSFIAPPEGRWWQADSRAGIDVPLGRAGATKRQHLQLGIGTSQHVLIAGKTGSGKSTLLHALITNLALFYSPDEIELYLIDFKKGVEFKTYAEQHLPHGRVIAIESEREFGLSVLQKLDSELKQRGDLFREAGVQDLASFRNARPEAVCPRLMLIVDEFQEYFTEDDKISQEAALLLDRLVRQGRAFGLHVLLGSQTLGGAYSLARSTIDQMAVRIALQCSEADANLILSKDNSAARLLSRPGEAIYNDANGLLEGNDFFQVVWLPEERRERYLTALAARPAPRRAKLPTIVFEGTLPADLPANHLLQPLLAGPRPDAPPRQWRAWLGDALAIKDPTAAIFRRQTGSHLLMIGQQAESARALFTSSLVSLVAQRPTSDTSDDELPLISLFDGTPTDDADAEQLAKLAGRFDGSVQLLPMRELGERLEKLGQELERRQREPDRHGAERFVFVFGVHRFRDLRKADDDFSFRRGGESAQTPAQRFATLLREGPVAGIHLVLWCDTLTNTTRALDRAGLREVEMRVLFQMGVADSSTLIDSPAASKLGLHRALFAWEEQGPPEKFRPYRLPPGEWLDRVGGQTAAAVAAT